MVCFAIAATGVFTALVYGALPERFPIHFGRTLRPDACVGKPFGPLVLPAVAAMVFLVTSPAKAVLGFIASRRIDLAADILFAAFALSIVVLALAVVVLALSGRIA